MTVLIGIFIIIVAGIASDTAVKIAKLRGGGKEAERLRREVNDLAARLDQQTTDLADAHATLADLQERVDFAERMLTQSRDRSGLDAGPSAS